MKGFRIRDSGYWSSGSGLAGKPRTCFDYESGWGVLKMAGYLRVEDPDVYQRLCRLHREVCTCVKSWPSEERFELCSQIRRSSNSSPANLAEKHSDRDVNNKIEGVNRARGEALETIHHLSIARLKGFITLEIYEKFRERYLECVRMLNGIEMTLEKQLPRDQQRWNADSPPSTPASRNSTFDDDPDLRILNPEPQTLNPLSEPLTLNPAT